MYVVNCHNLSTSHIIGKLKLFNFVQNIVHDIMAIKNQKFHVF